MKALSSYFKRVKSKCVGKVEFEEVGSREGEKEESEERILTQEKEKEK